MPHLVVVGAELAESFPKLRVALVAGGELMPMLGGRARAHARAVLGRLGAEIHERARPLLAASGLPTAADGRVKVDAMLRAQPDLYVAGDAAMVEIAPGRALPAGCKAAMPMAAQAADNAVAELTGAAPQAFRFGDPGFCVSLGRRDGIIQFVEQDGRPREALLTGRLAAWLKEQVCRFTVWSLHAERRGLWGYRWRRPGPMTAAAAEVTA